ncbi:MAG: DNA polymerase domain-containing protein [Asgard group archaeon]|nr:DNA polymerase domain-containing protein [Asgard group archaeon]
MTTENLVFMLTDIDYVFSKEEGEPIIRLYGRREGEQVLVHVRGFRPYFYLEETKEVPYIIENDPIIQRWQTSWKKVTLREYFWAGKQRKLIKLYGSDPRKMRKIVEAFEKLGVKTFETDISFIKRFLLDNNLKSLNVLEVKNAAILKRKGREIIAETRFTEIEPVPKKVIPSAEMFYKMKLLAVKLTVEQEQATKQQLLAQKNKRVLSIAIMWGTKSKPENGKLFFLQEHNNEGEKRLILNFLKKLQEIQPDILCTFQGDSFDLPYLFGRMRQLRVPSYLFSLFGKERAYYSRNLLSYRLKGRMCFDLALRTWGIHPKSGKKDLEDIAQEVLGKNRLKLDKGMGKLWREAIIIKKEETITTLSKALFTDVKLIYELYWKLGMNGWLEVLRTTGFPPAEASSCTERINGEFELMRYLRRKGIIIPKRPSKKQIEQNRAIRLKNPHEGGTVLYPMGRLHTGVFIVDFRSMYPSVMIAHNIGGETIQQWLEGGSVRKPEKQFQKQTQSCLAIMEKDLIEKRSQKKAEIRELKEKLTRKSNTEEKKHIEQVIELLKREEQSMKIVANSMYGAHFYIRSRFYSQTLAGAIANGARKYLLEIEKNLQRVSQTIVPCELIYGDTDSAFIKIHKKDLFEAVHQEKDEKKKAKLLRQVRQLIQEIIEELNKTLPEPVELQLEDIAYRIIFKPDRKKAYSYVSLLSKKLHIKGLEAVRSDWSPLARNAQRKILDIILNYPAIPRPTTLPPEAKRGQPDEMPEEFLLARLFLIALGKKILCMSPKNLLPNVTILSPIRRHPSKYKAKTPAVQAFLKYAKQEQLDINTTWMTYDKFPWVITPGEGRIYDRAQHPKYANGVDRKHYVKEILRCCEDLGVKVQLADVQKAFKTGPLNEFFQKTEGEKIEKASIATKASGRKEEKAMSILPYGEKDLLWTKTKKHPKTRKIVKGSLIGQARMSEYLTRNEKE